MEDSRLDWLDQQFSSLMTMFEGFLKKSIEQMNEQMEGTERMEKNIDNLLSKKGFDIKKMKSSFRHSATLKPRSHNPISPPSNSTASQSN